MTEKFILIKHTELTSAQLDDIIRLKQQHWKYSYECQLNWIKANLQEGDLHLLMQIDGVSVGYLNIVLVDMHTKGTIISCKGIGNVCVDLAYRKQGFGRKIMEKANEIIRENQDIGVLLCRSPLVPFYESLGWKKVDYTCLEIQNHGFHETIMFWNSDIKQISSAVLTRNF